MSRKIVVLFLINFSIQICFGASTSYPSAFYSHLSLHPDTIIKIDEWSKYSLAKMLFDSYLNNQYFNSQCGFFAVGDRTDIYEPVKFLIDNKSGAFYELFGNLGECQCPKFNRETQPFRKVLERALLYNFTKYDVDKSQPIVYTSVGSGALFEDLLILTKLLEQGYRNITINLIDSRYKKFIERGAFCIQKIGNVQCEADRMNDIFYDFLKWFGFLSVSFYPGLVTDVFVYSKLEAYLCDVRNGSNLKSDIGVVIDFDGVFGLHLNTPLNYLVDVHLNPFYCSFFDQGIRVGGIYGFAVFGNFDGSSLQEKAGVPILKRNVLFKIGELEQVGPVTCLCGIKKQLKTS